MNIHKRFFYYINNINVLNFRCVMNYLFYLFYVTLVVVFELQFYLKLLYKVQLSGYTYRSLAENLWKDFKESFLYWFLYIIIFVTILVINYSNIIFLTILMIVSGITVSINGDGFFGMKKVKYTKRVIRILCVSIIFLLCYMLFSIFVISKLVTLTLMPFILLLNYPILLSSLLILSPLEKHIRNNYIKQAKLKLSENRGLIKIGITGSYGKTSTKEILGTILSQHNNTLITPESYNTPMGISKTILKDLTPLHEVFVCEMGAKKEGEIRELCNIVDVGYGIVTSVGRQHTSTFGSIENIFRTKKELSDYLKNGYMVFNITNAYVYNMYNLFKGDKSAVFYLKKHKLRNTMLLLKTRLKCNRKYIHYDTNLMFYEYMKIGSVYAKNINASENGLKFDVYANGCKLCVAETKLIGIHNVINILLAVAMAIKLNVSGENIELGIKRIEPIRARLEKFVSKSGAIVLNNGYNSGIDSVDSSLNTLLLFDRSNKLVITPGLIENKDNYETNFLFAKKLSRVATEVVIVKRENKSAIYSGLIASGFDMSRVYTANSFRECRELIDMAGKDYVILIENDLPDNYI